MEHGTVKPHPRCISVAIGKGGVGKTSITTNIAGLLAQAGYRVLVVSGDPQDNVGEDLGYANAGQSDDGENLAAALLGTAPLTPLRDVRPNLDVAPGGDVVDDAAASGQIDPDWALAQALDPIADDYELIFIDCPPGNMRLQHLALVASRWVLIPTSSDASSRRGLTRLAHRFVEAREINPDLGLLGAVLFDVPSNATRVRRDATEAIRAALGESSTIFTSTIRTAKAAAHDARERGQLMHEVAAAVATQPRFWERKRTEPALAGSAVSVAGDYARLAEEIVAALAAEEADDE